MSVEVLLSAMHLDSEDYIDTLNIHTDCVVINQCDRNTSRKVTHETPEGDISVTYVETSERGLSKSRNMAISNATGDVCILCDNDVEYVKDYDRIIDEAFRTHSDADVIVFFIKRPERQQPLFDKPRRMGYLSVLKIFSPEIAFRRDAIGDIGFNELFGAGAKYFLGEENLFLYECLKRGRKIVYVPEMIAKVRPVESTWFKGYDRDFFISRGANYAAMSRMFSPGLIAQFALRKRFLYSDRMSMKEALSAMFAGRKQYLAGQKGDRAQ
ncbi:MAG: glycosyltransferase [Lachnospiraceae bacterium]|nr:glycosyltransferase [Lachnospiraceae bacterium]